MASAGMDDGASGRGRDRAAADNDDDDEDRRESEERFRLLVRSVADYAIFLLEPDGTVASWNLGAQRLKGYEADEIVGRHFSTFYTDDDRRQGLPATGLAAAVEQGRWEHEGWRVRKDGSRFWADVVITALRGDDGTLHGFAKVTRDLTERKQAEDALRDVLERERETSRKLRELDRLKTDLVAIVAHDLRGPVEVIRSLLRQVDADWGELGDADRHEHVTRARHRADRLATFVDDVFDVARIEAGELQVASAPFDLEALIAEVIGDVSVSAPDRDFDVRVAPGARVVGDERRTWQVIANLVSNAVKYSPPGSPVVVSVDLAGDDVVTSIADRGAGIPPDLEPMLFKRFSRLPQSAPTAGSGMGLFIARSLVEAQGGRLWLESTPGSGSTFRFTLRSAS